ncbi:hypothetical protein VII00023_08074 [Vibrio ichthyoenteri ATCC 700023]|uniref:Uncharacterized protein n=1 Tax=Vibrio ichthyoenteri ATCC 700023 TaxID=870968 RepID=F9S1X0_9VIBR|nr:hypothetical protein [Vibrio ichthyoenteri]EGU40875.1 hypothetical protein VII00023_08074 [Vibrio ichthyoenteri ATCC 700023]
MLAKLNVALKKANESYPNNNDFNIKIDNKTSLIVNKAAENAAKNAISKSAQLFISGFSSSLTDGINKFNLADAQSLSCNIKEEKTTSYVFATWQNTFNFAIKKHQEMQDVLVENVKKSDVFRSLSSKEQVDVLKSLQQAQDNDRNQLVAAKLAKLKECLASMFNEEQLLSQLEYKMENPSFFDKMGGFFNGNQSRKMADVITFTDKYKASVIEGIGQLQNDPLLSSLPETEIKEAISEFISSLPTKRLIDKATGLLPEKMTTRDCIKRAFNSTGSTILGVVSIGGAGAITAGIVTGLSTGGIAAIVGGALGLIVAGGLLAKRLYNEFNEKSAIEKAYKHVDSLKEQLENVIAIQRER